MSKRPLPHQESKEQRGLAESSAEPRFLVIGRITKPHGVRGEVRVEVHTDLPERFNWIERVYVGENDPQPIRLEQVRFHGQWVLLKLEGYDDRLAAESLRAQWLQIPEEEALSLEEGEYFLYQVIGLNVISDQGEQLGQVSELMETGANNVFVVHGPLGEILLPDTSEVIQEIDFDKGQMVVHLLSGLLP